MKNGCFMQRKERVVTAVAAVMKGPSFSSDHAALKASIETLAAVVPKHYERRLFLFFFPGLSVS